MTARAASLPAEREAVAAAGRHLAARGLVYDTSGNISVRAGDRVAITPTGGRLGELDAEAISVVDLDGAVVDGELSPTSELDLHLGCYRRHGAGAVVHTHSPVATALGLVLDELPCVHYEMLALGGTVPVAPYRTFATADLAAAVLDALGSRPAALMANHGAIVHGADLTEAVRRAEGLERACELYWRAASLGTPRALDAEQRQAVVDAAVARGYGTTRRA